MTSHVNSVNQKPHWFGNHYAEWRSSKGEGMKLWSAEHSNSHSVMNMRLGWSPCGRFWGSHCCVHYGDRAGLLEVTFERKIIWQSLELLW